MFAYNISLLHPAHNDFIGIIPSSILAFFHFVLVSIAEIIFYFQGIHEQFHIGYCVWSVSLLHPAHKDFIGIITSSIPAFFYFILVSIAEMVFMNSSRYDIVFGMYPYSTRLVKFLSALFPELFWLFWILYWFPLLIFMVVINSLI